MTCESHIKNMWKLVHHLKVDRKQVLYHGVCLRTGQTKVILYILPGITGF